MSTKAASKNLKTKDELMDAATRLMISRGYAAATVDEICEASKVTKGSFFHYFKSKEDLARQLIKRFAESSGKSMVETACCKSDDPLDHIYGYIECAMQMARNPEMKGCLIGTFSQEVSDTHPELRNLCSQTFQEMAQVMRRDFIKAKALYAPKASFDSGGLAEMFVALLQGGLLLRKVAKNGSAMETSLKHFKGYVKSLYGK